MSNFDFIATYVDLSDSPTYTTNITLEGQLLKISFVWNERIGKRTIFIRNSADICYLQNTILHPNESFELNSNAIFDDLPYKVVLQKAGDTNKVGNIYNWSKDFILCFYRTVDVETDGLIVRYGVTTPSTATIPPSGGGTVIPPSGGGTVIAYNEMHFTTTTGALSYLGNSGDVITLSDGTSYTALEDGGYSNENVPSGRHKVKLVTERSDGYVGIDGEALIELHNFPTLSTITNFDFCPNSSSPNLVKVPTVLPSNLTNLNYMFLNAASFNQDISMWDTSNVTDMSSMFCEAGTYNQPISNWDVSNVTTITQMFFGAEAFNQPLNTWNTANVTDMSQMFRGAILFNQPIGSWNTANVTDMSWMFVNAFEFNQDLSQWCVPLITDEPIDFNVDGIIEVNNLPVWGTCPRGENIV